MVSIHTLPKTGSCPRSPQNFAITTVISHLPPPRQVKDVHAQTNAGTTILEHLKSTSNSFPYKMSPLWNFDNQKPSIISPTFACLAYIQYSASHAAYHSGCPIMFSPTGTGYTQLHLLHSYPRAIYADPKQTLQANRNCSRALAESISNARAMSYHKQPDRDFSFAATAQPSQIPYCTSSFHACCFISSFLVLSCYTLVLSLRLFAQPGLLPSRCHDFVCACCVLPFLENCGYARPLSLPYRLSDMWCRGVGMLSRRRHKLTIRGSSSYYYYTFSETFSSDLKLVRVTSQDMDILSSLFF